MEFKEQSKKQVVIGKYEITNNGYKYDIEVNGSSVTMRIYVCKETILDDGGVSIEQSAFPIGTIALKDRVKSISINGEIDEHLEVFNEFIITIWKK